MATGTVANTKSVIGYIQEHKVITTSSNGSGLINITDHGVDSDNAWGCTVMCTTSNYKVSTPILWSNGNYYVVLTAWNGYTPVANTQVKLIITWYHT